MLSTKDLEEIEDTFRNVDSITFIKTMIITFITFIILYNLFSY
jgi:hypothetical protein